MMDRGRPYMREDNLAWKAGRLDEIRLTSARADIVRIVEEWPVQSFFLTEVDVWQKLPSPVSLHSVEWVKTHAENYGTKGMMEHILSGCQVALTQERYRSYDKSPVGLLEVERKRKWPTEVKQRQILFVREWTANRRTVRKTLLDRGQERVLRVDLDRKLVFPTIMGTTLQTGEVLVSQQPKTVVTTELTMLWAEQCEEAHEKNSLKYGCLQGSRMFGCFLLKSGVQGSQQNQYGSCLEN